MVTIIKLACHSIFTLLMYTLPLSGQPVVSNRLISIKAENSTLNDALLMIEKTSNVKIVYMQNIIPKNYRININVDNRELSKVLQSILGTTHISWKEIGGHIVLYEDRKPIDDGGENLVNVINVYDTIVKLKYDTITNLVYDTLLIQKHDTIFHQDTIYHDIYKKFPPKPARLTFGITGSQGILYKNHTTAFTNEIPNQQIVHTMNMNRAIYGNINFHTVNWSFECGVGLLQQSITVTHQFQEYELLNKDTTVYYTEIVPASHFEGGNEIFYEVLRSADSTYSIFSDSVAHHKRSESQTKFRYITIPITASYKVFNRNSLTVYIKTGTHINIASVQSSTNKDSSERLPGQKLNNVYYTYVLGLSSEYQFRSGIIISADILSRGALNSKYNNVDQINYITGLSASLGVHYVLKYAE